MDQQSEFGEGEGEQVMELVDESGALANDGLEPAGDLSDGAEFEGQRRDTRRLLGEGVAGGGAGFDGVGLLGTEEGGAVVLVALGIAAGDGHGEPGRVSARG